MAAVLLDTTVIIDLLRGRQGAAARLVRVRAEGDSPYVCTITVEETYRGLRPDEAARTRTLFDGLMTVPLGTEEGRRAGAWRRAHAGRGRTLAQADCLIAAASAAIGGRLATGNPKDFPMAELAVEHWPVGE